MSNLWLAESADVDPGDVDGELLNPTAHRAWLDGQAPFYGEPLGSLTCLCSNSGTSQVYYNLANNRRDRISTSREREHTGIINSLYLFSLGHVPMKPST